MGANQYVGGKSPGLHPFRAGAAAVLVRASIQLSCTDRQVLVWVCMCTAQYHTSLLSVSLPRAPAHALLGGAGGVSLCGATACMSREGLGTGLTWPWQHATVHPVSHFGVRDTVGISSCALAVVSCQVCRGALRCLVSIVLSAAHWVGARGPWLCSCCGQPGDSAALD